MVLSEQCRTVSEMVDGLPGILGGRMSFPFHKIISIFREMWSRWQSRKV